MKCFLFICNYRSVYSGNFIKSMCALKSTLERNGNKCLFLFPNEAKTRGWISMLEEDAVVFTDFNGGFFSFFKTVKQIVRSQSVDIIHTHFISPDSVKAISYFCNVKVFVHIHSDFSKGRQTLKRRFAKFVSFRIFASRLTYISVSKDLVMFNPRRTVWIPNAVVKDMKCRNPAEVLQLRRDLNISKSDVVYELFGWSPEVKGVDIAVEAIRLANAEGYHFKLAIVCGSKVNKQVMMQYINDHTACNGEESFLIYLPPIEDVFLYHHFADILLSASRSEGFPYSVGEMLSLGKRCVVSDIPGTSWARQYNNVVAFRSGDTEKCKEALIDSSKIEPLNSYEAERFNTQYTIEKWVNSVISVYKL